MRKTIASLGATSQASGWDTQNTRVSAPDGVYRRDSHPCERLSPKTSTPTTLTTPNENDIKGAPNGDDHDAKFDPRPKWPFCLGIGGRIKSESVAAFVGMRTMADITLGIEEELMIVDPRSRDVVSDPDEGIMARASELADGHKVVNELLRSQIETNSRVCASVAEIERSLKETRRCAIDAARAHGARIIASSTHPWARWQEQKVTQKERYQRAEIDLQDSVRQFFIGGMHIHAGFGDDDRRIEVMHAFARLSGGVSRALLLVALPGRASDRAEILPADGDRRIAAHWDASGDAHARRLRGRGGALPRDRSD